MKVSVEELSGVQRRVTVELEAKEVDKAINKLYNQLKGTAKIKGFRPGKVPRPILERYYGDQVAGEASQNLIGASYGDALSETSLEPIGQPDFDFEAPTQGQDFTFKIIFDIKPEFELEPDAYKGFEIKEPKFEVSDEEIDQRLEQFRERQAMLVPLEEERPAEIGDVVVVDYQTFEGEEPVEGGTAENADIDLGSGSVQQEIEVALVKASVGDTVETTVHFDDDTPNQAMAGKDIRFVLTIKALKKKMLPELDDDFARGVGAEFDNLAALRDRLKDDMAEMQQQQKDQEVRRQILDYIRDLGEFDLPSSVVAQELEEMVEDFKRRLQQSGMDPEAAGLDDSKLTEDFQVQAEKKVRAGIVLGKISDMESVEVSQEDMDAEFETMSQRTGQSAQVLKDIYNKNNALSSLTSRVMEEKTLQAIKAGAIIVEVDPEELAGEKPAEADEQDDQSAS